MLKFSIIVALGYIIGKIIQLIVIRSVTQVTKRTKTQVDDELIALLKRPIFLTVLFFFLVVATKSLDIAESLQNTLVRIVLTLIVMIWLVKGFKILSLLLRVLSDLRNRYKMIQRKTVPLFDLVGKIGLVAMASTPRLGWPLLVSSVLLLALLQKTPCQICFQGFSLLLIRLIRWVILWYWIQANVVWSPMLAYDQPGY